LGWVSFLNPTYGSKKKSTRLAAGKREKEKKGKKGKKVGFRSSTQPTAQKKNRPA